MVVNEQDRRRSFAPWIVAGAVALVVGLIVAVAVVVYIDRQQNAGTGPSPEAVRKEAAQRIQELQEEFKAYSEADLDYRDLLPQVRRFVEDYPDRMDGHLLLGQVYIQLGRWADAHTHFDLALKDNPDNFELQKLAGTCAAKLGRWQVAEAHLQAAMSMKSDRDIHLYLGNVYYQTGRDELAEQQYTSAINKPAPTPPHKAYSGMADLKARQGQYEEALKLVEDAIAWGDHDAAVDPWTYPLQRVRILMDAGEMDAAGALLIAVIDQDPAASYTLDYVKLQARLWEDQDKVVAIPGIYEDLVSRLIADPDRDTVVLGEALADLAHWRLMLGQKQRAQETLRSLRSVRPDHPRLNELELRLAAGA